MKKLQNNTKLFLIKDDIASVANDHYVRQLIDNQSLSTPDLNNLGQELNKSTSNVSSSETPKFPYIRQSAPLNIFNRMNSRDFKKYEVVRCSRTGEHKVKIDKTTNTGTLIINISIPNELSTKMIKTSTQKVVRFLILKFTQQGSKSRVIRVTLNEYMHCCGRRNKNETRMQLKHDLDLLSRIDLSYNSEDKKSSGKNLPRTKIFKCSPIIKNSEIKFEISEDFYKYLLTCRVIPILPSVFAIDIRRQPYVWAIANKLLEHRGMNNGKPNQDVISVRSLIQSYNPDAHTNKRFTQLIKQPFEEAMKRIKNFDIKWTYCNDSGVNDRLLRKINENTLTREEFWGLQIRFTISNYPNIAKLKSKSTKRNRTRNKLIS